MDERQCQETLVERYLTNLATNKELEVFLELLRQGKLDDVMKGYLDREASAFEDTGFVQFDNHL